MRKLGWDEYIAHQCGTGVYSEEAPCPENDPRVVKKFIELVKAQTPDEPEAQIIVLAEKYGYYFDAIDTGREGANVAGSSSLIDISINVPYAEFIKDLPRIREEASETILTDSFSFADGYGNGGDIIDNLVWLNSPVAGLDLPFEAYLESLTSERRKKYRRSVADFEKTNLTFEMSDRGLSTTELDFIQANLVKKWGEDADYAYRQTLWFKAVQDIRPEQTLVMRVTDQDRLAFIQTMIVKGQSVYCQSIAKDEENFFNGLAAYTDFECIKALCGNPSYAIFDPSCRTSLDDPESIGIAKRATVNRNCVKPILAIGNGIPAEIMPMIESRQVQGKEV
ncbi:MAG: hypothetical protein DI551_05470 [Micavibrio aeruginosavorus]|uniref:Uncharacterized protein n=1 Tax=Micavibrio aeruginosavorus TaxID=349221 RepID=A0A2W5PV00_9BACT|nr:MAG: hypothetical protein DI551_05470 [Micavibrio aeruginosavorus]